MPRTKKKPDPTPRLVFQAADGNGPLGEVLTLGEAAAYLRLPEQVVLRLVQEQYLPARQVDTEWRLLKSAVQGWLSQAGPGRKEFWETCAGAFKDDPHLEKIVKEAYRRRGRRPKTSKKEG